MPGLTVKTGKSEAKPAAEKEPAEKKTGGSTPALNLKRGLSLFNKHPESTKMVTEVQIPKSKTPQWLKRLYDTDFDIGEMRREKLSPLEPSDFVAEYNRKFHFAGASFLNVMTASKMTRSFNVNGVSDNSVLAIFHSTKCAGLAKNMSQLDADYLFFFDKAQEWAPFREVIRFVACETVGDGLLAIGNNLGSVVWKDIYGKDACQKVAKEIFYDNENDSLAVLVTKAVAALTLAVVTETRAKKVSKLTSIGLLERAAARALLGKQSEEETHYFEIGCNFFKSVESEIPSKLLDKLHGMGQLLELPLSRPVSPTKTSAPKNRIGMRF